MGAAISTVRSQITDDANDVVARERLNVLVKLAKEHLKVVEQDILNGRHGDQQIHAGTVIELERYYAVNTEEKSELGEEAGQLIESFVSGEIVEGVKSVLTRGANILFGSKLAGESEYSQMLVFWEHNTLIRLDVYHWKYQFSSSEIMQCVESVYAALAMKRVVDIGKVRSPVLVYSISRAAECYSDGDASIKEKTQEAVVLHKEAKKMKALLAPMDAGKTNVPHLPTSSSQE